MTETVNLADVKPSDFVVVVVESGSLDGNTVHDSRVGRLGAVVISTVSHNKGYPTRCYIEDISGLDSPLDEGWIKRADCIGFSGIQPTRGRTETLIKQYREINQFSAKLVAGGPDPTFAWKQYLDIGIDVVVRYEGEESFLELLEAFKNGRDISGILGICYRSETGGYICNDTRSQMGREGLNRVPKMNWNLVYKADKRDVGLGWRSRGCLYDCEMCQVTRMYPQYTLRDEAISLEEFGDISEQHSTIFLVDDIAEAYEGSFCRFCEEVSQKYPINTVVIQSRAGSFIKQVPLFDPRRKGIWQKSLGFIRGLIGFIWPQPNRPLVKSVRKLAHKVVICIGAEGFDKNTLGDLDKMVSARKTKRGIKIARRAGLVMGMIIAMPEHNAKIIKRTGRLARRLFHALQWLFLTPLDGTPIAKKYEQQGRVMFGWKDNHKYVELHNGQYLVIEPDEEEPLSFRNLVVKQYAKFYSLLRVPGKAVLGLLFRWKGLNTAQKKFLKSLPWIEKTETGRISFPRALLWLRWHLEYKLYPAGMIVVGKRIFEAIINSDTQREHEKMLRDWESRRYCRIPSYKVEPAEAAETKERKLDMV